ncbi:hypothetical protein TNCV_73721 [Trichonephila clavipes]|nr:hypothetical protein TNCV_73721 [Trichonephila clavipes]
MLESFQNVFEPGGEATNILEHHINTGNSPPISVPPYRMSPVKNCPDCVKYKASLSLSLKLEAFRAITDTCASPTF